MPVKTFLVPFLLFAATFCRAQDYIGNKRPKVREKLENYMRQTGVSVNVIETDSSLLFPLNDPKFKPVDFLYAFDGEDKCVAEIRTGCDSCLALFMQQALEQKKYQWRQTGNATFHSNSRFRVRMALLPDEKGSRLEIRKVDASRGAYLRFLQEAKRGRRKDKS